MGNDEGNIKEKKKKEEKEEDVAARANPLIATVNATVAAVNAAREVALRTKRERLGLAPVQELDPKKKGKAATDGTRTDSAAGGAPQPGSSKPGKGKNDPNAATDLAPPPPLELDNVPEDLDLALVLYNLPDLPDLVQALKIAGIPVLGHVRAGYEAPPPPPPGATVLEVPGQNTTGGSSARDGKGDSTSSKQGGRGATPKEGSSKDSHKDKDAAAAMAAALAAANQTFPDNPIVLRELEFLLAQSVHTRDLTESILYRAEIPGANLLHPVLFGEAVIQHLYKLATQLSLFEDWVSRVEPYIGRIEKPIVTLKYFEPNIDSISLFPEEPTPEQIAEQQRQQQLLLQQQQQEALAAQTKGKKKPAAAAAQNADPNSTTGSGSDHPSSAPDSQTAKAGKKLTKEEQARAAEEAARRAEEERVAQLAARAEEERRRREIEEGPVDQRHYDRLLDEVPPARVTVPVMLYCLVEQVCEYERMMLRQSGQELPEDVLHIAAATETADPAAEEASLVSGFLRSALSKLTDLGQAEEEGSSATSGAATGTAAGANPGSALSPPVTYTSRIISDLKHRADDRGKTEYITVQHGDDLRARQAPSLLALTSAAAGHAASIVPNRTPALDLEAIEAHMLGLIRPPTVENAPPIVVDPVDAGIKKTELFQFTQFDPIQVNRAISLMELEEMIQKQDTSTPAERWTDWRLLDRTCYDELTPAAFAQTFDQAVTTQPTVLQRYHEASDSLLVALNYPTPPGRTFPFGVKTEVWNAPIDGIPNFQQWHAVYHAQVEDSVRIRRIYPKPAPVDEVQAVLDRHAQERANAQSKKKPGTSGGSGGGAASGADSKKDATGSKKGAAASNAAAEEQAQREREEAEIAQARAKQAERLANEKPPEVPKIIPLPDVSVFDVDFNSARLSQKITTIYPADAVLLRVVESRHGFGDDMRVADRYITGFKGPQVFTLARAAASSSSSSSSAPGSNHHDDLAGHHDQHSGESKHETSGSASWNATGASGPASEPLAAPTTQTETLVLDPHANMHLTTMFGAEPSSPFRFVANFGDDRGTSVVRVSQGIARLTYTCANGLMVTCGMDGVVHQSYLHSSQRQLGHKPYSFASASLALASDVGNAEREEGRYIMPDGRVVRNLPDGTSQVLCPDGRWSLRETDGTWKTTGADGVRYATYPDGTEDHMIDPIKVSYFVDPESGTKVFSRADLVIIIELPDGGPRITKFPDGTHIVTAASNSKGSVLVTVHCIAYPSVTIDVAEAISYVALPDNAHLRTDPQRIWLQHPDGAQVHAFASGEVAYEPPSAGLITGTKASHDREVVFAADNLRYIPGVYMMDLYEGSLTTIDPAGNHFAVHPDGSVSSRYQGQADIEEQRADSVEPGPVHNADQQQLWNPAAADPAYRALGRAALSRLRIFTVRRDGSAQELIEDAQALEYIMRQKSDPQATVVTEEVLGDAGSTALTVMRIENALPRVPRPDIPSVYDLDKLFPPVVAPTTVSVPRISLAAPKILNIRQLVKHVQLNAKQRDDLLSGLRRLEEWRHQRSIYAASLQIQDDRDDSDLARQKEIQRQIMQAREAKERAMIEAEQRAAADAKARDVDLIALVTHGKMTSSGLVGNAEPPSSARSTASNPQLQSQPRGAPAAVHTPKDPNFQNVDKGTFHIVPPRQYVPEREMMREVKEAKAKSRSPAGNRTGSAGAPAFSHASRPQARGERRKADEERYFTSEEGALALTQLPARSLALSSTNGSKKQPGNANGMAEGVYLTKPQQQQQQQSGANQQQQQQQQPQQHHAQFDERDDPDAGENSGYSGPASGGWAHGNTGYTRINANAVNVPPIAIPRQVKVPNNRNEDIEGPAKRKVLGGGGYQAMPQVSAKSDDVIIAEVMNTFERTGAFDPEGSLNRLGKTNATTFSVSQDELDLGHLRRGATKKATLVLRNMSTAPSRIHVKPPVGGSGLKVNYAHGLVAPGMDCKVEILLTAPRDLGSIESEVEIKTETEIYHIPVFAEIIE